MEQFKAHEERMKAYQKAKRAAARPPLAQQPSSQNIPQQELIEAEVKIKNTVPVSKRVSSKLKVSSAVPKGSAPTGAVRKSSNGGLNGSSKSTTAHTNDNREILRQSTGLQGEIRDPDSDDDIQEPDSAQPHFQRPEFVLEQETGQRGAKPESNKNLEVEQTALTQKKDKCMEIFKNSSEVRELITSDELNPDRLSTGQLFDMLFSNRHFLDRK